MFRVRPSWFGPVAQSALLLLPLAVLVTLGAYFIRQDRKLVETETRESAEALAERLLASFLREATNLPPDAFDLFSLPPEGVAYLATGADFQLVFPPPVERRPAETWSMNPHQSKLWFAAERAEFRENNPGNALTLLDEVLATEMEPLARPAVEFQRTIILERLREGSASRELESLARTAPVQARLESGLPVPHAAGWKLLRSGSPGHEFERFYLSNVLAHPTEFTAFFLAHESEEFARARLILARHEQARELRVEPGIGSQEVNGESWVVFALSTNVVARSEGDLEHLLSRVSASERLPTHFRWSLELGTRRFGSSEGIDLARAVSPEKVVSAISLAEPQAVYRRQTERAWLFGGLLMLSSVTGLAGVGHIVRSHRRHQRLSELKSNFVASVSHELRAPLASIRLLAEGLQSGRVNNPEKRFEYYNFLVQEARRLSTLVENVLDFSRIEQDRKRYQFEEADVRDIVESALQTIAPIALERNISLSWAAPDRELRAHVDSLAIQQAVLNLLDNAVKHSPPGQTVEVSLALRENAVEISVADRGPGIPPGEHERIFERFYRLGSELRRETQGVGIGLSIVKHAVEAHGGTVSIRSAPGQGATFLIRLPVEVFHA